MKLDTQRFACVLILNLIIFFLHSVHKKCILGKRGSDFQKYFLLNNIRDMRTFNGVNSEIDNFWGKLDEKV